MSEILAHKQVAANFVMLCARYLKDFSWSSLPFAYGNEVELRDFERKFVWHQISLLEQNQNLIASQSKPETKSPDN